LGSFFSETTSTPATAAEEFAVASAWPEIGCALSRAAVPPRRPATAAARARELIEGVFIDVPFVVRPGTALLGVVVADIEAMTRKNIFDKDTGERSLRFLVPHTVVPHIGGLEWEIVTIA
jgi:hypothetical protein